MNFSEKQPEPVHIKQQLRVLSLGNCLVGIWCKLFKLHLMQGLNGDMMIGLDRNTVGILHPALLDKRFPFSCGEIETKWLEYRVVDRES